MERPNIISTAELARRTAGGDSYIRTKDGEVMGVAITKKKNPKAPKVITVSKGERIIKNAEILVATVNSFPVYLKLGVNQWLYKGEYIVERYSTETRDIRENCGNISEGEIHGILFLKKI